MSIQIFPITLDGLEAVKAIPDPKNLIFSIGYVTVHDGVDYAVPVVSQDQQDRAAAKAYGKLVALQAMTPAQVQAWVAANVTNLAQAQDAIATLAIAVSILSRSL